MSHKYKCCSIFFCCIQTVISCFAYCFFCQNFSYFFFIFIDNCCITSHFTKQWFCNLYRFKLIFIIFYRFHQFVIFCTMHQMSRLDNQILYTVGNRTFQCLLYIVNFFSVTCLNMINNYLCSKCSSYRPFRICCLQCIFNSLYISHTAVIERSSEADYKNFILADFILITGIILRRIPGISSKVIRVRIFTFYQFFLCVSQFIPCSLCIAALFICIFISFLYIDCVN